MAFQRQRRSRIIESALDMTPLIDVVFLLVIFLLISTAFKKPKYAIEVNEPTTGSSEYRVDTIEHMLRVNDKGKMALCPNEPLDEGADFSKVPCTSQITPKQLKSELKRLAKAFPEIKLGVYADAKVTWDVVLQVIQAARDARLSFNLHYKPSADEKTGDQ